jgi:bifunctional non-homologous end joining protein LigD
MSNPLPRQLRLPSKRATNHRSPARFIARTLPGAKPAPFPGFIQPCLPTIKLRVPDGERWVHEIKHDGYRVQGQLIGGEPHLMTRRGHDWTHRMGAIADALGKLPANHLVVDGEMIVPDDKGRGDFSALEAALGNGRQSHRMLFYLFDVMHLDGFDLRAAPLLERKRVLAGPLDGIGPPIVYSEHIKEVDGAVMFEHACKLQLEAVVSKQRDAPYRSGRNETWIKVKCSQRDEFAIVGFEPEGKSRIAALHLARKLGRIWSYMGKVGTGFSGKVSVELRNKLDALMIEKAVVPLANPRRSTVAVKPALVAKVEYRTITADGQLRHASFKGGRLTWANAHSNSPS